MKHHIRHVATLCIGVASLFPLAYGCSGGTEDDAAAAGGTGTLLTGASSSSGSGGASSGGSGGAGGSVPPAPACGDGSLDPGESCDDGNKNPYDGCLPDCTKVAPLDTPKLTWTYVEVPGTICMNGETAGFGVSLMYVHPGTADGGTSTRSASHPQLPSASNAAACAWGS